LDKLATYLFDEKVDGKYIQWFIIHYNCVGNIEIPQFSKIPEFDVTVNTRQGVNVSYSSTHKAV